MGDIQVYHDGMLKQTITKREMRWKNGEVAVLKSKKIKLNGDTLFLKQKAIIKTKEFPLKAGIRLRKSLWYFI